MSYVVIYIAGDTYIVHVVDLSLFPGQCGRFVKHRLLKGFSYTSQTT